jgi:outer membrane receptor protein involved in Fe transport
VSYDSSRPATAEISPKIEFNIPKQSLADALAEWSKQSGLQVLRRDTDGAADVTIPDISGKFSPAEALEKMLAKSGLRYEFVNDRTVRIAPIVATATTAVGLEKTSLQLAQNTSNARNNGTEGSPADAPAEAKDSLEEIVVTGTHIRGVRSTSSPVITITQEQIQRSGYASTRELLASLPQNSQAGFSEQGAISPSPDSLNNVGGTTSVNLRGLGPGSTLTLINGHRIAPNGLSAAVDISAIPLSAISKVEVLADGASAVYGSDAVGGVVNFILKNDGNDITSSIQYGEDNHRDVQEHRGSQLLAHDWGSGAATFVYEYYDRDPLLAGDRDFSAAAPSSYYLTAGQHRNSFVLNGNQDLSTQAALNFTILASDQSKSFSNPLFETFTRDRLNTTAGALGLEWQFLDAWQLELNATYSRQKDNQNSVITSTGTRSTDRYSNDMSLFELKADGPLFELPAGPLRIAAGAGARRETLKVSGFTGIDTSRNVSQGFVEAHIPLVGSTSATPTVALDLAARAERYSDFGWTTNPKVGVSWEPSPWLKVRSTWGTSFRAPTLYEKSNDIYGLLTQVSDPASPSGQTLALITLGSNPQLDPQKADTFTAGIDVLPYADANFKISVTYFDVLYTGRIQTIDQNIFGYLENEAVLAPAIIRDPSASLVSGFIDGIAPGHFFNLYGAFTPGDVGAYLIGQSINVATSKVSGLDFFLSYRRAVATGTWSATLDASHLFEDKRRASSQARPVDRSNTIFYTPALKIRGGLSWARRSVSVSTFWNYVNSYDNTTVTPQERIGTYSTFDAQVAFEHEPVGISISLNVRNILNEQPPTVRNAQYVFPTRFGYDPANADAIGRFATILLSKRW